MDMTGDIFHASCRILRAGNMDKSDSLDSYIGQLTGESVLLLHFCEIQYRYSCIPAPAVELRAASPGLPPARINGVIDYDNLLHHTSRGEFDIQFSDSIADHTPGGRELLQQLCERHCLDSPEMGRVYLPGTNARCIPLQW